MYFFFVMMYVSYFIDQPSSEKNKEIFSLRLARNLQSHFLVVAALRYRCRTRWLSSLLIFTNSIVNLYHLLHQKNSLVSDKSN